MIEERGGVGCERQARQMQKSVKAGHEFVHRRAIRAVKPRRRRNVGVELRHGAKRVDDGVDHQSMRLHRLTPACFVYVLASVEKGVDPGPQHRLVGCRPRRAVPFEKAATVPLKRRDEAALEQSRGVVRRAQADHAGGRPVIDALKLAFVVQQPFGNRPFRDLVVGMIEERVAHLLVGRAGGLNCSSGAERLC